MRTLKRLSYIALVTLLVISCKPDKQSRLVELRKEHDQLATRIQQLENELMAPADTLKHQGNGIPVTAKAVIEKPFTRFVEIHGRLDGEESLNVHPKGAGIVQRVFVGVGTRVTKGQVLATLDDAAMVKALQQTRAQYSLAAEVYQRQSALWEQRIGSEIQYLQAKTQKETLESAMATLEEQIDNMKIKSPINGSVESFTIKIGESVSPAMPVAKIINFNSMKVVSDVSEAFSTSISKGDSVLVSFPDLKLNIPTTISTASRFINPLNRTFQVEARLEAYEPSFKANMVAVLRIADYTNPLALSIPVNLVQTDSTGDFVFVSVTRDGNTIATKKHVEQGISYNGIVEITRGLEPGDKIITSGHLQLSEGVEISVQ